MSKKIININYKALFILRNFAIFVEVFYITSYISAEDISTFRAYIDASTSFSIVLSTVVLASSIFLLFSSSSIKSKKTVENSTELRGKVANVIGGLALVTLVITGYRVGVIIGNVINNITGM